MARPRLYDEPRAQTSIRLPADVHDAARQRAHDVGGSLSRVVELALRAYLDVPEEPRGERWTWK